MTLLSIVRPALACVAAALLAGCSARGGASQPVSRAANTPTTSATPGAWSHPVLAAAEMPDRGDSELWAQSCSRCHNAREPGYYSPGQWTLVMQQMRVRGYLTGEESRRISAFLRDAGR